MYIHLNKNAPNKPKQAGVDGRQWIFELSIIYRTMLPACLGQMVQGIGF
jgi:hypothetical protein